MSRAATGVKRILVVEDEAHIREMLADVLKDEGYAVETAENGAVALRLIADRKPDLVLLDLMMPFVDGWAFTQTVRRRPDLVRLPIVLLSAATDLDQHARRLDVQAFIAKPFDLNVVLSTVERLTRGRV